MPSPKPVEPDSSRAITALTYSSLLLRLPPFSIKSANILIASTLLFGGATFNFILTGFKMSVIFIIKSPLY